MSNYRSFDKEVFNEALTDAKMIAINEDLNRRFFDWIDGFKLNGDSIYIQYAWKGLPYVNNKDRGKIKLSFGWAVRTSRIVPIIYALEHDYGLTQFSRDVKGEDKAKYYVYFTE